MADLICRKTMTRCQTQGMCSPHGGCQHSHSAAPRQPAGGDGLPEFMTPELEELGREAVERATQDGCNSSRGLEYAYGEAVRKSVVDDATAIIDGLRAENETLRKRAKTAEREAESALKTYKGLEKVARVVSENSDQVCGELNVMRQERDQLAQRLGDMEQILRDLMPGCKGPLMRQRIDNALSAGKAAQV